MSFWRRFSLRAVKRKKPGEFKAAALCAAKNLAPWFGGKSLRSLKNRYPVDSMIGARDMDISTNTW